MYKAGIYEKMAFIIETLINQIKSEGFIKR